MAFLSHDDSDSTLVVTSMDSDRNPQGKEDMSFEKEWSDATVESEIWRGKKLRETKPLPDPIYEPNVADIDFLGSFVKQCRRKKNKYPKNKTNPSSPNSKSPHRWRPNSADISYSAAYSASHKYCVPSTPCSKSKTGKNKKCPMRIAELAVPSKRQCIDTWRNKSDILPQFMVERLKQHVLDQRPIVKIPEAVICFQRRSSSPSKTRCKSATKKRENNLDLSKPCRHMDSRTLSIIFAHRIAKKLSKQMNLTLDADLKRLSKIIHEDIAKLLAKCTFSKKPEYRAIHTDVSNKITIWVTSILEDLSLKLLEEDLKARLQYEANAELAEQFATLVETFLKEVRKKGEVELEEEEGPVLDLIDDLFDNVIDICEPPPIHVESESPEAKESETPKAGEMAELLDISLTPVDEPIHHLTKLEEIYNIGENENFSDEEYLRREIQNVMDNIRFEPEDYLRNEISNIIDNIHKESGDNTSDGSADVTDKHISANIETDTNFNNTDLADNNTSSIKGSIKMVAIPTTLKYEYIDKYKNTDAPFDKSGIDEHDDNNIDSTNDGERVDDQNADEHFFAIKINDENVVEHDDENVVDQVDGHVDETVKEHVDESGKNDSNVSEHYEILLEDSGDEKDDKKVKIYNKDLVIPENIAEQHKQSVTQDATDKQVQASAIADKTVIVFSAPNTNLLRVQLHTAPSWVTSWGFGRGEPSDESIPMQIMPPRVTESDVRKWCKDLEKAYINLEMWSHWIHNTCKETMHLLKQRRMTCPGLAKRHAVDWIKLRKNIHKDAILWAKLYTRTETNFKDLTSKYNNVEYSPNYITPSTVVKTILETMSEIENMSVELHKMIVAAEYCAFCHCDRNASIKQRK